MVPKLLDGTSQANHDCSPSCEVQSFGLADHTIDLTSLRDLR